MKAKSLVEIRELIASSEFRGFWDQLRTSQQTRVQASEQYDELLTQAMLMDFRAELAQKNAIDTLYRAGEAEDQASTMAAEAQDLENRSFKTISDFEEHRYQVSDLWYRL